MTVEGGRTQNRGDNCGHAELLVGWDDSLTDKEAVVAGKNRIDS